MVIYIYVYILVIYMYLHINDQATHQRKNLKLPYLHCYTRNICEIWRVET